MANDKELAKALKNAFDVCFEISDAMGNIIAASSPPSKSDVNLKKKSDDYIKWYRKTFNQS